MLSQPTSPMSFKLGIWLTNRRSMRALISAATTQVHVSRSRLKVIDTAFSKCRPIAHLSDAESALRWCRY